MDREAVRVRCLTLPGATESLQWGDDLVFKVGGKMFAAIDLRPDGRSLSFKCPPDRFHEWLERAGVRPAPYLARAQWVRVEDPHDLSWRELSGALAEAYAQVLSQLPKKVQRGIALGQATEARRASASVAARAAAKPATRKRAAARPAPPLKSEASTPAKTRRARTRSTAAAASPSARRNG